MKASILQNSLHSIPAPCAASKKVFCTTAFKVQCIHGMNASSAHTPSWVRLPKELQGMRMCHDKYTEEENVSLLQSSNLPEFVMPEPVKTRATLQRGPYKVVITGSTKGIGLALAKEFLKAGDKVVISSRSAERVERTVVDLQNEFGESQVTGVPCDVSKPEDVANLAETAKSQFGSVDVWINNAGSNAYKYGPLIESDEDSLREIVETNTLGVMLCCRQAIITMKSQPSGGHIFNMDGAGADGNPTPRFAAYGATKRSLAQFTKSMQAEIKMLGVKNVVVHNLSPGMVTTELLMSGGDTAQAKFFINVLAEPAEEVASFLVPRVREICGSSSSTSSYVKFLTQPKALTQILARLLFNARKDKYLLEG